MDGTRVRSSKLTKELQIQLVDLPSDAPPPSNKHLIGVVKLVVLSLEGLQLQLCVYWVVS